MDSGYSTAAARQRVAGMVAGGGRASLAGNEGPADEVPQDIRAFFGHPLTAASSADDMTASSLALLHEYENLPAIDRTDAKVSDKLDTIAELLRSDLRKTTANNDIMMLLPASDIHTFINCNTIPDDMMGLDSTDDDAAANESFTSDLSAAECTLNAAFCSDIHEDVKLAAAKEAQAASLSCPPSTPPSGPHTASDAHAAVTSNGSDVKFSQTVDFHGLPNYRMPALPPADSLMGLLPDTWSHRKPGGRAWPVVSTDAEMHYALAEGQLPPFFATPSSLALRPPMAYAVRPVGLPPPPLVPRPPLPARGRRRAPRPPRPRRTPAASTASRGYQPPSGTSTAQVGSAPCSPAMCPAAPPAPPPLAAMAPDTEQEAAPPIRPLPPMSELTGWLPARTAPPPPCWPVLRQEAETAYCPASLAAAYLPATQRAPSDVHIKQLLASFSPPPTPQPATSTRHAAAVLPVLALNMAAPARDGPPASQQTTAYTPPLRCAVPQRPHSLPSLVVEPVGPAAAHLASPTGSEKVRRQNSESRSLVHVATCDAPAWTATTSLQSAGMGRLAATTASPPAGLNSLAKPDAVCVQAAAVPMTTFDADGGRTHCFANTQPTPAPGADVMLNVASAFVLSAPVAPMSVQPSLASRSPHVGVSGVTTIPTAPSAGPSSTADLVGEDAASSPWSTPNTPYVSGVGPVDEPVVARAARGLAPAVGGPPLAAKSHAHRPVNFVTRFQASAPPPPPASPLLCPRAPPPPPASPLLCPRAPPPPPASPLLCPRAPPPPPASPLLCPRAPPPPPASPLLCPRAPAPAAGTPLLCPPPPYDHSPRPSPFMLPSFARFRAVGDVPYTLAACQPQHHVARPLVCSTQPHAVDPERCAGGDASGDTATAAAAAAAAAAGGKAADPTTKTIIQALSDKIRRNQLQRKAETDDIGELLGDPPTSDALDAARAKPQPAGSGLTSAGSGLTSAGSGLTSAGNGLTLARTAALSGGGDVTLGDDTNRAANRLAPYVDMKRVVVIKPQGHFTPPPPPGVARDAGGQGGIKSPDSGFNDGCLSPTLDIGATKAEQELQGAVAACGAEYGLKRRSSGSSGSTASVEKTSTIHAPIIKLEPESCCYCYCMDALVSTNQKLEEDRMTYLNKGQFYGIVLQHRLHNGILRCNTVKSIISVVFREEMSISEELKLWEFWHSRQHTTKHRILEIDTKNCTGILMNCIDEIAHNAVAIRWNPREPMAKVNIAINCLSTDFSNQKGVKGLPLHVQIDTFEDAKNPKPVHRGYCQVKVFCDKGAERKTRDEERRKDMKSKASDSLGLDLAPRLDDELYHPACDTSAFYSMADTTTLPVLFNPVPDYEDYTQKTMPEEAVPSFTTKDSSHTSCESRLNHRETVVYPAKRSRTNSYSHAKDIVRVLIYVRERHECVFTALLLHVPTLDGLTHAIEEKYHIPAANIRNVYKRSQKGLLVRMDENILRHYSNESTFIITIRKNEQTHETQLNYDVTLDETDSSVD